MSFKKTTLGMVIASVMMIGLTACDNDSDKKSAQVEQASSQPQASEDHIGITSVERYNKYVEFVSRVSSDTRSYFVDQKAKFLSGEDEKFLFGPDQETFHISLIESVLKQPGAIPSIDTKAQAYLDAFYKVRPTWLELYEYNSGKRYEDDNGAKGKTLYPTVRQGVEEMYAAKQALLETITAEAVQQEKRLLEQYKASGDMEKYHISQALYLANEIIELFNNSSDEPFKNAEAIEKANTKLVELDASLDEVKKIANDLSDLTEKNKLLNAHKSMVEFTGYYREARKGEPNSVNKVDSMISAYNQAVNAYN